MEGKDQSGISWDGTAHLLQLYIMSSHGALHCSWFHVNRLASPYVRWLIQIPRLHSIYRSTGDIANFKELLDNIFVPLFEVTIDPSINPSLHLFLKVRLFDVMR